MTGRLPNFGLKWCCGLCSVGSALLELTRIIAAPRFLASWQALIMKEGQRNALAELEPSVTLWWAYALTTSSRDARERSIEPAGST